MKTSRMEVMIHFREQCNRLTECSHGLIGVVTRSSSSALYKAKSSARLCACLCARTTCAPSTGRAPTHLIFSHFLQSRVVSEPAAPPFSGWSVVPAYCTRLSTTTAPSLSLFTLNALTALFASSKSFLFFLSQLSPGSPASSCATAICPGGLSSVVHRCSN